MFACCTLKWNCAILLGIAYNSICAQHLSRSAQKP